MGEEQFEKYMEDMVKGDKQGLRMIYEAYIGYIYTIVYGILGNRENAEDVTSEFFIRLWEKAGQYRPGKWHKGYLAAMARNMSVDYLRKYKKEELTAAVYDMESRDDDGEGRRRAVHSGRSERDKTVSVENEVIESMTLKEELPDFWERIEAGVEERQKKLSDVTDSGSGEGEEEKGIFGRKLWIYSQIAVACLCIAIIIPAIYFTFAVGRAGSASAPAEATVVAPAEETAVIKAEIFAPEEEAESNP